MKKKPHELRETFCKNSIISLIHFTQKNSGIITEISDFKDFLQVFQNFLQVIKYKNSSYKSLSVTAGIVLNKIKSEINIVNQSFVMLGKVFARLPQNLHFEQLNKISTISDPFLSSSNIPIEQKLNVLQQELPLFNLNVENSFTNPRVNKFDSQIDLRLDILFDAYYDFDTLTAENIDIDKNYLQVAISTLINLKVTLLTCQNQIFQAFTYLLEEFDLNQDLVIKEIILNKIVIHNSSFQLKNNNFIQDLIDDNRDLINEEKRTELLNLIDQNPQNLEISTFETGKGSINQIIVDENPINTLIKFTLPTKITEEQIIILDDSNAIIINPISNQFLDPIYLHYKDLIIGGMPWNHFLDSNSFDDKNLATITFLKKEYYGPDIALNQSGYTNVDFSAESAARGMEYYPHKEHVITTMQNQWSKIESYIDLTKSELEASNIKNFLIEYKNGETGDLFFRKLIALTTPSSYQNTSIRFLDKVQELNFDPETSGVYELVQKIRIENENDLQLFLYKLLHIVLKNDIENHSAHQYFWRQKENKDKSPALEPFMQPLIFTILKSVLESVGIIITKEPESSNGKMDFYCTYTNTNGKPLKVVIELKNAHGTVEEGLQKQLPRYLRAQNTRYGIYVVLWYKGDFHDEPKKYDTIIDLQSYLNNNVPSGMRIKSLIIDCNKPISPSKEKL